MDFKNKLGTVDAHNLNLNFKPDNTDSHNIIFNFEHLADGSTNLNFGDDVTAVIDTVLDAEFSFEVIAVYADSGANTAVIDTVLDTEFSFEFVAVFGENTDVIGQIDTVLDTSFSFEVEAVFSENICTIDTVLDTSFSFEVVAVFDINFIRGLNHLSVFSYQKALPALLEQHLKYGKSRFKAHNSAFIFERGLSLSNAVITGFDKTQQLQRAVHSVFEETTGLSSDLNLVWQENDKRFIARTLVFEEAEKLLINRQTDWQEMIRKRKKFTFNHEVAHVFEKRFTFEWDKGLEFITTDSINWDVAKPVYYRKSEIKPFPPKPIPEYVGSTDLNFVCLCHDVDSHNIVLNFGANECLPNLAPVDWWYIVNEIKVTRLDNGQEIQIYSGDYSTDRSSWSWSYNLTIPFYEKSKTEPIEGQPVILKIMINGNEHRMLLENISRSRQFGKDVYKLSGRSPTALLDAPYSPTRSFTQENERTSVQLVQAELDRVNSDIVLNWDLIDALGWILPPESLSYSNLTPIAAIKLIVEAAGGFIYSEPNSNTLTIKPLYKKTWWDSIAIDEYDRVIPESIVTDQSTDYQPYPDYNGVFLTNDRTGDTGQVKRIGTAGDLLQESINSPLLTSTTVMHSKGREVLAKAGLVENHSLLMPITQEIGLCLPGELVAFNGDWWGIVDGVRGSFTHKLVNQTVSIERVNRE
ncbi:hypothetical protein N5D44_11055 [Acinetobacter junii]|uniref:hypothetical protein n=1 Tax=Acinetobacter junii TaxID=40215 RepID=UPI00244B1E7A|nr:hypothetical protein [Acinetobacter junii]MDH1858828.1 hypothetical protein [Acinetobacter junii]